MNNIINGREIRVGVLGALRGASLAKDTRYSGLKIVAICDKFEYQLNKVVLQFDVKGYTDFDKFLTHEMDAVIIASSFHQHAPFAIKAMDKGLHVLS